METGFLPTPATPLGLRLPAERAAAFARPENFQRKKSCGPPESARGLAHSKTLCAIRGASASAPASWSAVALHRFSRARKISGGSEIPLRPLVAHASGSPCARQGNSRTGCPGCVSPGSEGVAPLHAALVFAARKPAPWFTGGQTFGGKVF